MDRRTFLAAASVAGAVLAAAGCEDQNRDIAAGETGSLPPDGDEGRLLVPTDVVADAARQAGLDESGLPPPTAAFVTRWGSDPFAVGSYSYLPAGVSNDARDALRVSVDDRMWIAGEATSSNHAGTVHGALFEGVGAAERMLQEVDIGDRVIVIGAGACGLAAANVLADAGLEVIVVEGRRRVGGRIHTDRSSGAAIELGALYVHGSDGNPVVALAERARVDTVVFDDDDLVLYDAVGSEVEPDAVEALVESIADLDTDDDRPLAEIADARLSGVDDETRRLVEYLLTSIVEHDEGAPITRVSPASIDAGEDLGDDELVIPGGYDRVLTPLVEGLDIRLGHTVARVVTDASRVSVVLADGRNLDAERVIVTVPLGVLQRGVIEFDPPLPTETVDAISRLGMGVLDRVALTFDERFWDDRSLIGFLGVRPGVFVEWNDVTDVVGRPALYGFNAADVADALSTRSDTEILKEAFTALIAMYGN